MLADLEEGRFDSADERQMRVGDANVVKGKADVAGLQPVDGLQGSELVAEGGLLGDLEDDPRRIDVVKCGLSEYRVGKLGRTGS